LDPGALADGVHLVIKTRYRGRCQGNLVVFHDYASLGFHGGAVPQRPAGPDADRLSPAASPTQRVLPNGFRPAGLNIAAEKSGLLRLAQPGRVDGCLVSLSSGFSFPLFLCFGNGPGFLKPYPRFAERLQQDKSFRFLQVLGIGKNVNLKA
jgi:hypothetical protein